MNRAIKWEFLLIGVIFLPLMSAIGFTKATLAKIMGSSQLTLNTSRSPFSPTKTKEVNQ